MRGIYYDAKPAAAVATRRLDAGPWLESIYSTLYKVDVDNVAGVQVTHKTRGTTIELRVSGGSPGSRYRIGITATAGNGQTRYAVYEVTNLGIPSTGNASAVPDRLTALEARVAQLEASLAALSAQLP